MKQLICFVFFLHFASFFAQSQTDSLSFPASWQGSWQGELEIYNSKGLTQSLPMELHIQPMDSSENYTWTIYYGEDTLAGKRDYELVTLDAENGWYAIDEKNSIQMEGYLLGEKFFQRFEVMGNLLLTTTEKVSETELLWEIISGKLEAVSVTGKTEVEGEEIPAVKTFPIGVLQRARLVRAND